MHSPLPTDRLALADQRDIERRAIALAEENARWPAHLVLQDEKLWRSAPGLSPKLIAVWRSRSFLMQVFKETPDTLRLSINRTTLALDGGWEAGITWDELQRLKNEAGFADFMAVEVFPAQQDVVNVANMRHLWVLLNPPKGLGWVYGRKGD